MAHTTSNSKEGLGRLPWILLAVASVAAGSLVAISHRSVRAAEGTVKLKIVRELPAWKPGPGWASAVPPEHRAGEEIRIPIYPPWTEHQALEIFGGLDSVEMFDAYCGKLYKPRIKFTVQFPEHPDKQIEFVTNSRSMREDSEPRAEKPALRVLVAGDSQTDGVCKNSESFANLAEAFLRRRAQAESTENGQSFDPSSIEVLNAGKGSHSFFDYLGVLERNLDLNPDVFVVTVYGGNDFDEVLTPWHYYFNQGRRPIGAGKTEQLIDAATAINSGAASQALNSVKYFAVVPDQMAVAVKAAGGVFVQIQAICRERGIRLLAMYLPPRTDVEPENPELRLRQLLRALELKPAALASTSQMADQLLAKLTELGVETIDLRQPFKEAGRSLYWNTDWHINLTGHQVIARLLVKALSARH